MIRSLLFYLVIFLVVNTVVLLLAALTAVAIGWVLPDVEFSRRLLIGAITTATSLYLVLGETVIGYLVSVFGLLAGLRFDHTRVGRDEEEEDADDPRPPSLRVLGRKRGRGRKKSDQ